MIFIILKIKYKKCPWTYVWACFFTMITVIIIKKKANKSFVHQLLKYSKILLKYRNMRKRSFRLACGARTAPIACIGARRSSTPWCTGQAPTKPWAGAAPSPPTSPRAEWRQLSRPRRGRSTTRHRSAAASSRPTWRWRLAHDLDATDLHSVLCIVSGS